MHAGAHGLLIHGVGPPARRMHLKSGLLQVLAEKAERLLMYVYPGYPDDGFEPLVNRLGLTIVRRADADDAALVRV
jgi:hypothetical protein